MRFPANLHLDHPSLEQISIKRVKSVETKCIFPSIGLIFIRGQLFEKNNNNFCDPECDENAGLFECVQMIRQQRSETVKSRQARICSSKQTISDDGYLIFAYKTMEDMCTSNFAASWKTWTGARLLCHLLPEKYNVKRLSFFRKVSGRTQFFYILIAQIADLMKDCAPALNVLNCIKPRICAFVGAYRIVTFKVDVTLCNALNVSEDQHLYAYTTSMKVNYSNHTAVATYPGYTEFRSDDEKPTKKEKKDSPVQETNRKHEETQTELIERPAMRRTLPRTISIYDFPSMKNSMENPHKESAHELPPEVAPARQNLVVERSDSGGSRDFGHDKKSSPIPVALVHPLPYSPTGVWVRKQPPRKLGCVMFQDEHPSSSKQRKYSHELSPDVVRKVTIDRIIEELLKETVSSNKEEAAKEPRKPRRAHSEVRTTVERRKWEKEEDGLLRRLKLLYFNSPEYTSEELRSADSE
ncbi:hypothetical protein Aduo_017726 [Ancylostoma duodenale]